jgi:transcription-repair coupling factor (superfamily II helicase)
MSEVALTPESIERFRTGYRALFGAVTDDDPLYAAVSEGRKHIGMEHWLPLFYAQLETAFDYLPEALVTLRPPGRRGRGRALRANRRTTTQARQRRSEGQARSACPTSRCRPDRLYLTARGVEDAARRRAVLASRRSLAPERRTARC